MTFDTTVADSGARQYGILSRPRLNSLLEEAVSHSVVVVTAGTGYGKSRAVSDYLSRPGVMGIWLQMTGLDNYPTRFWQILTHAVQARLPQLGEQMSGMGFPDTLELAYQFVQMLSAAALEHEQVVLVLDDFHKIEEDVIVQLIETIAFARLEGFCVVLISRYPLQLSYSSLYNNGLLTRVGVADLRFTEEETKAYYSMLGLEFTPEILQNIQRSTEGWPLAIYLIGLHRQNKGQLFNDPIACTIPLLYSLIEIEIFAEYTREVRLQFIRLSLFESIPLELVKLISGDNFTLISKALRDNMFAYYNPQLGKYHFHRLFRRFLQEKRGELGSGEPEQLYLLAADWYKQQQRYIEALNYYAKCGRHDEIWHLLLSYSELGRDVEMAELCLDMIGRFPPEFIEQTPLIRVFTAHVLLNVGEIDRAHQSFLEIVTEFESLPPTLARWEIIGEACIGLAHVSLIKRLPGFEEYYMRAAELLPHGSSIINEKIEYVGTHYALTLAHNAPGELQQMVDTLLELRPLISHVLNGCGYGAEYLAAAEGALFQYRLSEAAEYAYQALYKAQERHQHDIVFGAYMILTRVAFAEGEYEKTISMMEGIDNYKQQVKYRNLRGMDDIGLGWFYVRVGRYDLVPAWILANGLGDDAETAGLLHGREKIVKASYLMKQKRFAELDRLLQDMTVLYTSHGATFSLLQTHVLAALSRMLQNKPEQALGKFKMAYDIAYPNRLLLQMVECGTDMVRLLDWAIAAQQGYDIEWLRFIQEKAAEYEKSQQKVKQAYNLDSFSGVVPRPVLSNREQDLLRALREGLQREEIAANMGVTVSKVRALIKGLYAKLGAINRADAVRIAIDMRILE